MRYRLHGHACGSGSPTYLTWIRMKVRCYSKNSPNYKYYGGRGIKVCKRWLNSFSNFLVDMGEKPGRNYSLDRIDNNKNYGPNNCKWATSSEQTRNRRPYGKSGIKGVSQKPNGKWEARINRLFDSQDEAISFYNKLLRVR